jgi:hypothetical protein
MHKVLAQFINQRCARHPAARVQLAEFVRAFRRELPASALGSWSRQRIITDLQQAGFPVGIDQKVYWIGGLGIGEWREQGGQLIGVAHG